MSTTESSFAIVGGSGLYQLQIDAVATEHAISTPFADTPVKLSLEQSPYGKLWFLPRHGPKHSIAPHEINYRANLWALQEVGVTKIIAVNAVGGISKAMQSGTIAVPDQLIDYTWGREQSFFSGAHAFDKHIDFTWPYDAALAACLARAAKQCELPLHQGGVYACTQGPRLETAAEIRKLAADGCDVVGMTGMPEAALARELNIAYTSLALVVNKAAGLSDAQISMDDIQKVLDTGLKDIRRLLLAVCKEELSTP